MTKATTQELERFANWLAENAERTRLLNIQADEAVAAGNHALALELLDKASEGRPIPEAWK